MSMRMLPTLALVAGGFAFATPLHAQAPLEDLIVAVPNFTFTLTPTLVADELKLWEKNGLRFKMVQIQGVGATNAVISGSADFAQAGGSTLTRANARGQKLIAIANTAERNIVSITLRKELAPGFDPKASLAQRAQALRGRTIGVGSLQANPHAYLKVVAARAGIDPESIRVTAMEGNALLGAFQTKAIDGMSNSPPFPLKLVIDGDAVVIASGPDGDPPNAIDFAYNVVLTRADTCEKKKSLCQKLGRSYREANAFIVDHPKETIEILKKRFATLDPALIESAFELIRKSTPRVPAVTSKGLENADDFNVEAGFMKKDEKLKSYDSLFTNEYVQ